MAKHASSGLKSLKGEGPHLTSHKRGRFIAPQRIGENPTRAQARRLGAKR